MYRLMTENDMHHYNDVVKLSWLTITVMRNCDDNLHQKLLSMPISENNMFEQMTCRFFSEDKNRPSQKVSGRSFFGIWVRIKRFSAFSDRSYLHMCPWKYRKLIVIYRWQIVDILQWASLSYLWRSYLPWHLSFRWLFMKPIDKYKKANTRNA